MARGHIINGLRQTGSGQAFDIEASINALNRALPLYAEAGELCDDPSLKNFYTKMAPASLSGALCSVASCNRNWNPTAFSGSEERLVEGIQFYKFEVCGAAFKARSGVNTDAVLCGSFISVLALFYGNLQVLSCLLTLYTAVISFEFFPVRHAVCGTGRLGAP